MHKIIISEKAIQDLEEIKGFIFLNDPNYSEIVIEVILLYIENIVSNFPKIGVSIPITQLRIIIEPQFKYKIFYKVLGTGDIIEIISIYKRKEDKI